MSVGVVGAFPLPMRNYGTSSVYHSSLRLWVVPVLAAKLSDQGEMYGLTPLKVESYPTFVVCIRVAFECQRWKRDEVLAQTWGMCYVAQFYVYPSVSRAKSYGKVTVACDGSCPPVRKTKGSATLTVVGKTGSV